MGVFECVCVCVCVRWVLTLNHDASILQSTNVRKFTSIKHKYSQDVKVVLFHHFPDSDAWWCIIHMCAMMKETYRNIGLAWLSNPIFIDKPSSWWTNPYGWMRTTCEHSLRFAAYVKAHTGQDTVQVLYKQLCLDPWLLVCGSQTLITHFGNY